MIKKLLILAALLNFTSCEHTKSLWENSYEEKIELFLVSSDGYIVAFLGKKYHYIFQDASGLMKELLALDRSKTVKINTDLSDLKLDQSNHISGDLYFETFDLKLSPEQFNNLYRLGFRESNDHQSLTFVFTVSGNRYLSAKDSTPYFLLLDDRYTIKISRHSSGLTKIKEVSLTPITIMEDSVVLLGDVVLSLFKE